MSKDDLSYYEQIACDFANWISENGFFQGIAGEWYFGATEKFIARTTAELLHIFKTK